MYCAMVWAMTGGLGAYTKGRCAENSIDSRTHAQKQNNILYRPTTGAPLGSVRVCSLSHVEDTRMEGFDANGDS